MEGATGAGRHATAAPRSGDRDAAAENYLLWPRCDRSLPAADFAAWLELELPSVLPAAEAAFAPVTRELPVCDSALAAAAFAALLALGLRRVRLAAVAALELVWREVPVTIVEPFL